MWLIAISYTDDDCYLFWLNILTFIILFLSAKLFNMPCFSSIKITCWVSNRPGTSSKQYGSKMLERLTTSMFLHVVTISVVIYLTNSHWSIQKKVDKNVGDYVSKNKSAVLLSALYYLLTSCYSCWLLILTFHSLINSFRLSSCFKAQTDLESWGRAGRNEIQNY